jgi:hypothetical protein
MTGMNIMFIAKKLLPLKSLWTIAQTPTRNVDPTLKYNLHQMQCKVCPSSLRDSPALIQS